MKIQKKDRRAYAAKASALKRLLGRGMLLEGSLGMSMRGGSEHWQLTDKADGKTRTLYVPARRAAEVTDSIELWKRVREELKSLSAAAREAYANAFAAERDGARKGSPANGRRAAAEKPRLRGGLPRASKPKAAGRTPKAARASVRPKRRT